MSKDDFIFSTKLKDRIARHAVFCFGFTLIFTILNYGPPLSGFISSQSLMNALICDACYLPYGIFMIYVTLYFFYPVFLLKGRVPLFIIGFITVIGLGLLFNYYMTGIYTSRITSRQFTPEQKLLLTGNHVWFEIVMTGLAMSIKFGKDRLKLQKEIALLEVQKGQTELNLLKSSLKNSFIFRTLDDIYLKIKSDSLDTPARIIALSELLSYILYESDENSVPVEKEMNAIKQFVFLSETGRFSEIHLPPLHEIRGGHIPPTMLLNYLQNYSTHLGNRKTGTAITITDNNEKTGLALLLKRKCSFYSEKLNDKFIREEQKRLSQLFPGYHCLLKTRQQHSVEEIELNVELTGSGKLEKKVAGF